MDIREEKIIKTTQPVDSFNRKEKKNFEIFKETILNNLITKIDNTYEIKDEYNYKFLKEADKDGFKFQKNIFIPNFNYVIYSYGIYILYKRIFRIEHYLRFFLIISLTNEFFKNVKFQQLNEDKYKLIYQTNKNYRELMNIYIKNITFKEVMGRFYIDFPNINNYLDIEIINKDNNINRNIFENNIFLNI